MQRLLGQVRLLRRQAQRVVPEEVELQALQCLLIGKVEHLLQEVDAQHGLHRPVGAPVVLTVQVGKPFLVDQGKRPGLKHLRPTPLQEPGLLHRE